MSKKSDFEKALDKKMEHAAAMIRKTASGKINWKENAENAVDGGLYSGGRTAEEELRKKVEKRKWR